MRRHGLSLALLSLMAMQPEHRTPLVERTTRQVPGWWRKMCEELAAIGAYVKNANVLEHEEADVEFACPSAKVEEARAIVAKYMTKEAREAEAKALEEMEVRRGS